MFAVLFDLVDDPVRFYDPADQDAREQGDERHQEAVADIVHQIQNLSGRSVRQFQFKVEYVVAKADHDGRDKRINSDQRAHLLTRLMKQLHAVRYERLHDGYTGGQRREAEHQEKGSRHDPTCPSHRLKDLWQ